MTETTKRGLKDFVPLLRKGYCNHFFNPSKEPILCQGCQHELADLIESILTLWQQRRALEDIDPTDLM